MRPIVLSAAERQALAEKAAKLAGLPVSLYLDASVEDLIEAARDKSPSEIAAAERMRDMDQDDWNELNHGRPNIDRLIEFLATMPPADLEALARRPADAANRLSRDYLTGADFVGAVAPDTTESAEAATKEEQYRNWARMSWAKLTPPARASLLTTFAQVTGETTVSVLIECLQPHH